MMSATSQLLLVPITQVRGEGQGAGRSEERVPKDTTLKIGSSKKNRLTQVELQCDGVNALAKVIGEDPAFHVKRRGTPRVIESSHSAVLAPGDELHLRVCDGKADRTKEGTAPDVDGAHPSEWDPVAYGVVQIAPDLVLLPLHAVQASWQGLPAGLTVAPGYSLEVGRGKFGIVDPRMRVSSRQLVLQCFPDGTARARANGVNPCEHVSRSGKRTALASGSDVALAVGDQFYLDRTAVDQFRGLAPRGGTPSVRWPFGYVMSSTSPLLLRPIQAAWQVLFPAATAAPWQTVRKLMRLPLNGYAELRLGRSTPDAPNVRAPPPSRRRAAAATPPPSHTVMHSARL